MDVFSGGGPAPRFCSLVSVHDSPTPESQERRRLHYNWAGEVKLLRVVEGVGWCRQRSPDQWSGSPLHRCQVLRTIELDLQQHKSRRQLGVEACVGPFQVAQTRGDGYVLPPDDDDDDDDDDAKCRLHK